MDPHSRTSFESVARAPKNDARGPVIQMRLRRMDVAAKPTLPVVQARIHDHEERFQQNYSVGNTVFALCIYCVRPGHHPYRLVSRWRNPASVQPSSIIPPEVAVPMDELRLPSSLESSSRILVSGAGGGFDVYAGIPIYARLRALGKQVFLGNLSFTALAGTDARALTPALYVVDASTTGEDLYFPERTLAAFLRTLGHKTSIYSFAKSGVAAIREGYRHLVRLLDLDAIVLVDGGTDILLRGDEAGLGTPAEDMMSLAAVAGLDVPTRIVTCVGFGIDTYHGVCHANWLENVAALTECGGFLGATALLPDMPEVKLYRDAVRTADSDHRHMESIVNGSIVSAIEGRFGDYHRTQRTQSSRLFISPLMTLVWAFDLMSVARRNLYLHRLEKTRNAWDVLLAIEEFRAATPSRKAESIPY